MRGEEQRFGHGGTGSAGEISGKMPEVRQRTPGVNPGATEGGYPVHLQLLTVGELAGRLHVRRSTVERWYRVHGMPRLRLGRLVRFRPRDVAGWLAKPNNWRAWQMCGMLAKSLAGEFEGGSTKGTKAGHEGHEEEEMKREKREKRGRFSHGGTGARGKRISGWKPEVRTRDREEKRFGVKMGGA